MIRVLSSTSLLATFHPEMPDDVNYNNNSQKLPSSAEHIQTNSTYYSPPPYQYTKQKNASTGTATLACKTIYQEVPSTTYRRYNYNELDWISSTNHQTIQTRTLQAEATTDQHYRLTSQYAEDHIQATTVYKVLHPQPT
jgi:hypothetical protein